jgi:hypothetical protein
LQAKSISLQPVAGFVAAYFWKKILPTTTDTGTPRTGAKRVPFASWLRVAHAKRF